VYCLWIAARLQICELSRSNVGVERASTDARALDHSRALHQTECVPNGSLRAACAAPLMLTPFTLLSDQIWDRCEKVIYLLVDAALNYLFVRMVSTRLVDLGLTKVRPRHKSREVSGRSQLMHPPSPYSTTRCSSSTSGSALSIDFSLETLAVSADTLLSPRVDHRRFPEHGPANYCSSSPLLLRSESRSADESSISHSRVS
jgi:hypothetical protein